MATLVFVIFINTESSILARVRWSVCIPKSQKMLRISFFRTDSFLYDICKLGQILIAYIVPIGSPSESNCVLCGTSFVQVRCILLLYKFILAIQFMLEYNWSSLHCLCSRETLLLSILNWRSYLKPYTCV